MERLIVGVILTLLAGGLWTLGVYFLRKGVPALFWPLAKGRILTSTVDAEGDGDLAGARLSYEYFVDGERYGGKRISAFDGEVSFSGMGERLATDYPEGSEVRVAHHPERKAQSMLRPGPGLLGWSVVGAAALFSTVALLTLFRPGVTPGQLLASLTGFGALIAVVKTIDLAGAGDPAARFSQTRGRIVSSEVVTLEADSMGRQPGKPRPSHFSAAVRYSYEVGGKTFESSRIQAREGFTTNAPSFAEATVNYYPVGREVLVSYDARNPQRAVLVRGSASGAGIAFGALAASMLAGATAILYRFF